MKIIQVKVIVTNPGGDYTVVKVLTDEGVHGVGEGTLNGSELAVAEAPWHSAELLVGMNPDRIEDIWHLMYHHAYWRRGPVQMAAVAAIDMGPWRWCMIRFGRKYGIIRALRSIREELSACPL